MRKRGWILTSAVTLVMSTALLLSSLFPPARPTSAEVLESPPTDCPILISELTTLGAIVSGKRGIFSKAGTDNVYVVLMEGIPTRTNVRIFMKSGNSFSEQDTGDKPTAVTIIGAPDSRFDGTLIHVVYVEDDGADYNVMYVTFDTSTNQWGTAEVVTADIDDPSVGRRSVSVSLDSGDKPHVLYTIGARIKGKTWSQLKYKNKTGAAWSAQEDVHVREGKHNYWPTLGHESDDRFVAVWWNTTDGMVIARTRSSVGVWDTIQTVKTASSYPSLTVDASDSKHVALETSAALYVCTANSGASQSWTASSALDSDVEHPSIGCSPNRTQLYVVYNSTDTFYDDALLAKKEDTNHWSLVELQGGGVTEFRRVSIQDPTSCNRFGYIWRDADVYGDLFWWDEYQFRISSPGVAVAPGGLTF